jgi:hypothetical protein
MLLVMIMRTCNRRDRRNRCVTNERGWKLSDKWGIYKGNDAWWLTGLGEIWHQYNQRRQMMRPWLCHRYQYGTHNRTNIIGPCSMRTCGTFINTLFDHGDITIITNRTWATTCTTCGDTTTISLVTETIINRSSTFTFALIIVTYRSSY